MWLISALLGYTLLAIVFILDKHILAQEVRKPIVYTFYITIFLLLVALAWLFIPLETDYIYWITSLLSGFAFGLAILTMFIAVDKSEASHLDPFIGAMVTIITFAGAYVFLGEQLTQKQAWGIGCLGLASLLLAIENNPATRGGKNKRHWKWYLLGIFSAGLFAISHLTSKFLYDEFGFLSGLVGSRFATGVFGLLILLFPGTLRAIRTPARKKANNPVTLVILGQVLGVIAILAIQYAVSLSSVAIVSALSGLQYVLMFIFILVLSRIHSKFLKEKFTFWETVAQVVGLALIILGLYLVV